MDEKPTCVLLISGKRKSGKDYMAEKLAKELTDEICCIVRISEPIKSYYAEKYGLDLAELMADGPYKEEHRRRMIEWSDDVRRVIPGYFCEAACKKAPRKCIWIVSDIRRKTDVKWFSENYGDRIKTVRIFADEEVRRKRGWKFTKGVDDVTSECDLDNYESWDLQIKNNCQESYESGFKKICDLLKQYL